jgi:hypothetical protein
MIKIIYFVPKNVIDYYGKNYFRISKLRKMHGSEIVVRDNKFIKHRYFKPTNKKISANSLLSLINNFDGEIFVENECVRI